MPRERRLLLDHAYLLSILSYERETGHFRWLVEPNAGRGRVHIGDIAGTPHNAGYVTININGTLYLAHRLAVFHVTGKWPDDEVDHKSRVRAENAWDNLRPATGKQQRENAAVRCDSVSQCRGVSWFARTQQWRARIYHNKKPISLGYHDSLIDAAAARLRAERSLFTHHRESLQ